MLPKQHTPTTSYWQMGVVSIFLAGVIWFVFGQTLQYDFINYDDPAYIMKNPEVTAGLTLHGIAWAFSHLVLGNWHPLTMITHMLDCQIYGLHAGGHHRSNILLHISATVLLFLVLLQMTQALWRSAFVAALFAIHPLRAESVAWIAERKDVLSGVFFMLTVAGYLRYVRKPSWDRYLVVVILFGLGLLSKPMLVTVPFVLLLLDYWPLQRFANEVTGKSGKLANEVTGRLIPRKLIWEKVPLLIFSSVASGIALVTQKEAMTSVAYIPLWVRIYNALQTYCIYIWQMVWPMKLALVYPYPVGALSAWTGLLATATLCAITYGVWFFHKRAPYLITGWWWYLAMLAPVIGLVQVGMQARADRYTYLPQIGLYIAITWAVLDLATSLRCRREILVTVSTAIILALAWRARTQTWYWKDSETIWRRSLAVNSNNAIAQHNLGYALLKDSRLDEAIFHLQEAVRISPDFSHGQPDPANAQVHDALGVAFSEKGRRDEAIFHYERVLLLRPAYGEVEDKLATAYWEQGKIDQAIVHWEKALSTHPDDPQIQTNLGTAFLRKQRVAEAVDHYEKSLAGAPRSIVTLNNLALLLSTSPEAQFRNGQRAVELAEQADQLSSRMDPLVIRTLASAYAESGRFDDALEAAKRALNIATAQKNSALAGALKIDINLYELNFPRRGSGP